MRRLDVVSMGNRLYETYHRIWSTDDLYSNDFASIGVVGVRYEPVSLAILGSLGVLGEPLESLVDIAIRLDHVGVYAPGRKMSYEIMMIIKARNLQKFDVGAVSL